jgi:hypothetical protein
VRIGSAVALLPFMAAFWATKKRMKLPIKATQKMGMNRVGLLAIRAKPPVTPPAVSTMPPPT